MKTGIQDGDVITVTAPYAVASGGGCLVGSLFGLAISAAAISAAVEIVTRGVVTIGKTTAEAWTQGQRLYWNDATKLATTTAAANKLIGVAAAVAGAADTTGPILLSAAFTL